MRGATLKKKVTSVKHKPASAGGIAMPGGLTASRKKSVTIITLSAGVGAVVWIGRRTEDREEQVEQVAERTAAADRMS